MAKSDKIATSVLSLASAYASHSMSMDVRHAKMVGAFIRALPPCDVYEVGCYHGISTAEILTSAKDGRTVFLVDYPRFQHNVEKMAEIVNDSGLRRVVMSPETGVAFLDSLSQSGTAPAPGAVVLLDGDHRWEVVRQELLLCIYLGFTRFILHDVANPAGDCDGPAKALGLLQREGFLIAIDQQHRPGERTDRGVAFCCKDAADHKIALEAVCEKC